MAIAQAKKTLVHDHIDHCLNHAVTTNVRDGRKSVEEFKAISKYL
jgi:DNA-binding FrmR family transcriptional regulator